jgi:OOP family OmpA-OmpF porin
MLNSHLLKSRLRSTCLPLLLWSGAIGAQAQPALPSGAETAAATAAGRSPVVVSGVVPDEASRQLILARVREVYGSARVLDQLGVGPSSAPPQWAENVKKLVTPELRSVQRGHLRVAGNAVELVGMIDSAGAKGKIGASLASSLNPTYSINNQLQVSEAPQARIDSVLAGKIVEFEFSSAVLTATGRQVLDELMPVLATIEGRRLQVVGHTDAAGSRASNLLLSQERALAVKSYLASKGLASGGMLITGMGPDQPIASNTTLDGQAKNRRIEFKILP